MNEITTADILAAIEDATKGQPADKRCFTVPDLSERSGKPVSALRKGCIALLRVGKLETVRFSKQTLWGTSQTVMGFRFVNGKKK